MLQLLKKMQRREVIMTLICAVFVVGQVYFDLRLPDYMTELTTLIKTSGTTADIVSVGIKMLGCTCVYSLQHRRKPGTQNNVGQVSQAVFLCERYYLRTNYGFHKDFAQT